VEALIIPLIVLVAIGGIFLSYYLKKKRREEMHAFALQHGLAFTAEDLSGIVGWPFSLFGRGDGRGVENVITGMWKQKDPITAFDYWYYTESTDSKGHTSRSYHRFSCATVDVAAGFPHLEIAREGVFTWLADRLGMEDIEFESPEFNRRYNVKAGERRFAFELLDARMLRWLVDFDQGLAFEVAGNRLLAYRSRQGGSGMMPLIETLLMFRDQIPRVAWGLYPLPG
jgi:hypothetical protein